MDLFKVFFLLYVCHLFDVACIHILQSIDSIANVVRCTVRMRRAAVPPHTVVVLAAWNFYPQQNQIVQFWDEVSNAQFSRSPPSQCTLCR